MRIRRWLYEVFIGAGAFRAAYFWILIVLWIIGAIIIRLTPWGATNWASHWPIWSVYLPAGGLLIGFVICNVAAFSRACDRADAAEQQLRGLSIDLRSAAAGEHVYPEDIGGAKAHHVIVIELQLVIRNHDGVSDSTVELVSCTTNLRSAPCDRMFFAHTISELDSLHRAISAGDIRPLQVTAVCDFPISKTHIPATEVTGVLELRDNRKMPLTVPFSTTIIKNPVQVDRDRSCKVIRREEGKPDVVTTFPNTTSLEAIRGTVETDGYKVIRDETTPTPEDERSICTTIVTVESKVPVAGPPAPHSPVKPEGDR
jgi:hypothetical protein